MDTWYILNYKIETSPACQIPSFYETRWFTPMFKSDLQVRGFSIYFVIYWLFYGEELLALSPIPKLEGHPSSSFGDCLLAVVLHVCRPSSPTATWRRATPWWQGPKDPLVVDVNPLTPELNPSAQRCLARFFTGDFASWTVHFVNICVIRHSTPIHNILSTAPQLSISQKALGMLPEDGSIMPKHVGDSIHN
jgi:hypothetical protein